MTPNSPIRSRGSVRSHAGAGALACSIAIAAAAGPAAAQPSDDAAVARALFAEGRKLVAQGQYQKACPKFEESYRLDQGIGTQFNLADCWEHIGRTASAWARFLDVASAARSLGQGARERIARERAASLEPKLSHLIIDAQGAETALEIKRDGAAVGRAALGTPVPVDPGEHVIDASAPGKKHWTTRVQVPAAGGKASVAIPPLEDEPAPARAAASPPAGAGAAAGASPVAQAPGAAGPLSPTYVSTDAGTAGGAGSQRIIGAVIGGVGLAGVVVGAVFMSQWSSKKSDADAVCADHPSNCSTDEQNQFHSLADEAHQASVRGAIALGVGGAALVTGAILFFTAHPSQQAHAAGAPRFDVGPLAGDGRFGAIVRTRW